jgi:hypothetical protein
VDVCDFCACLYGGDIPIYLLPDGPMKFQKDFHFRGQMKNEEVIEFFRRHWIVILPQLLPFAVYMSAVVVFLAFLPKFTLPPLTEPFFQLLVILGIIGTGFLIHHFFLKMIEYFMRIVVITNYRIIDVNKTLFLHDDKQSIVMKRMQDLQKQQKGIVYSILNVGELIVIISFSEPKVIRNVPAPDYHYRLLNQIRSEIFERSHKNIHPDLNAGVAPGANPIADPQTIDELEENTMI